MVKALQVIKLYRLYYVVIKSNFKSSKTTQNGASQKVLT